MEPFWRIFIVFVTLVLLINGQTDNTEKGLVTSLFPGYWDPAMLNAYKGDIETVVTDQGKLNNLKFEFLPSPLITNMYPDVANSSIYYMDAAARTISRFDNFNMDLNDTYMTNTTIHEGLSRVLGSLAFDWISKNVYWTDGFFNWIGMQNAFSKDNLKYKVLIGDVLRPYALAVDPINGYMFWSDMAPTARIHRALLTGENGKAIQATALSYPNAFALDIQNQTLYFADSVRNTLEAISYSGLNRRIVVSLNGYDFGALALYDNYLCFSEQNYGSVLCHDATKGTEAWEDYIYSDPYGIVAYDKKLQPGRTDTRCPAKGCNDICVDMPTEAKCLCSEGYKLQNDGKTCIADHALTGKGILFTNGTHICVEDIRGVNDLGDKVHIPQCILANLSSVKYLQADSVKGLIFFWNTTSQLFKQYNLVSNKLTDISTSRTGNVTGLFYDWINYGLYWTESDTQSVKMIDLQDITGGIQNIQTNVQNVHSLTGDPHKSKLYWISGTSSITIESVNMDRTDRKTTVSTLNNPKGLSFSTQHDTLFWIDSGDILSFNIIKADKAEIVYEGVRDANIVLPYQDYLMFTSGESDIHAIALTSSNSRNSINITEHNTITGICIFDSRVHSKEKGACYNNGGCQHICAPSTSGPVCMCHYGFTLQPDKKSCDSVPYKNNFMLLVDYSHSMLLQVPTDKAVVTDTDVVALNITQFKDPVGVAYDSSDGFLYWSELSTRRLKRGKLDGENVTTVKIFTDHYPDRLVFHEGTGDLFFTATKDYYANPYSDTTSYIGVLRLKPDPKNPKHLILINDLDDPRCLTLYPQKGYIFYGEGGYPSYIGRANMDGTDQKEIAAADKPLGITVDYVDNMKNDSPYCYWSNDTKYNGRCSTFCLPVPGGKTCQCEDKVSLIDEFNCDNEKTCQLTVKNGAFTGICDGKLDSAGAKVSARTGGDSSASVSTVGGVLGAVLAILIIIIIIGAVCYFTRRREMRSAVYKNEPNVYFNNPPVDENSYSQFNQPTGGTGDRYHQFSNPMSETDNAYDMISEKKNNAPDENGPATYYLKEVDEKKLDTSFKP
ncbi:hypothetical protein KUTeg_022015 [Tegillarca granosa]|uniref:EGF-like domain-containing protein n=1 Tax=Tegillarca granosa TaxID=220873 RepID=A0ABQ9E7W7_TEGGR|nr:hypothetical protein KUTeg_022015 [Tegillarca granosa]